MLDKLLKKVYFYNMYIGVLFFLSLVIVITGTQVGGAILFGCVAALGLVLFSDITVFLIPALFVSVFTTVCYDSFETFSRYMWLVVPLVGSILFNVIRYKVKIKAGKSLRGLIAVAVAVTLGGLGTISPKSYFSPTSLYYVSMLGIGMVLIYLLFSARITENSGMAVAKTMYAVGMLAAFIICFFYYENWDSFVNSYRFLSFQPSNNLSTFMMLAMPFPLYFARKRHIDILATLFMYVCIVFSSSRGGLVMGTAELIILFVAYTFFFERSKVKKVFYIALFAAGIVIFLELLPQLVIKISYRSLGRDTDAMTLRDCIDTLKVYFIDPEESRLVALKQSLKDFVSNPLFGVGVGYTGNTHIYSPKTGAMNWYHLWTAQIFGGLGAVGVVAYLLQLVDRVRIYIKNASPFNMTLFMSYVGLWLMSQLNPGEFCPIPYALIAVVYFIIIERKPNEATETVSCI